MASFFVPNKFGNPIMRRCLAAACVLVLVIVAAARGQTYKSGDKVMVINWNAKLAERNKDLMTPVELGDIFTVTNVNGHWLWVRHGWILDSNVMTLKQAIEYLTAQIERDPNSDSLYSLYYDRAVAYDKMGEFDKALSDQNQSIRLQAGFIPLMMAYAYNGRGIIYLRKGEYDRALEDFNRAIPYYPEFDIPYINRGLALGCLGNYQSALDDFNESIRLDPKSPYPYGSRAWIWATCADGKLRDGAKAICSATRACELTSWRSAGELDTLAAAYAEKRDFCSAIKWEAKAINLGLESQSLKKPEGLRTRMALYKSGKPYREEPKGN